MMSSSNSSCAAWCSMHGRSAGLFLIRLFVGFLFVWQGGHKLFGGMDMFTGMVAGLGFPAPALFAWIAAIVEFFGGLLIITGGGLRVASALLFIDMLVAFFAVHNGSISGAGMASFVLIGTTLGLFFTGSGKWNVCRAMGMQNHGWACGCCESSSGCCEGNCACASGKGKNMKGGCCQDGDGHMHN